MRNLFIGSSKELGAMEIQLVITYWEPSRMLCKMETEGDRIVFTQTYEVGQDGHHLDGLADVEALRDDMLDCETPEDALRFLERCGPFFPADGEQTPGQQKIAWEEFVAWREHFQAIMSGEPTEVPRDIESTAAMKGLYPRMGMRDIPCRLRKHGVGLESHRTAWAEAACAGEAIDFLLQAESPQPRRRKCRNENCGKPKRLFIPSRADAEFCTQQCRKASFEREKRHNAKKARLVEAKPQEIIDVPSLRVPE